MNTLANIVMRFKTPQYIHCVCSVQYMVGTCGHSVFIASEEVYGIAHTSSNIASQFTNISWIRIFLTTFHMI